VSDGIRHEEFKRSRLVPCEAESGEIIALEQERRIIAQTSHAV
jgi:hypothetical protein